LTSLAVGWHAPPRAEVGCDASFAPALQGGMEMKTRYRGSRGVPVRRGLFPLDRSARMIPGQILDDRRTRDAARSSGGWGTPSQTVIRAMMAAILLLSMLVAPLVDSVRPASANSAHGTLLVRGSDWNGVDVYSNGNSYW